MAITKGKRLSGHYVIIFGIVVSASLVLAALLIVPYLTTNKAIQSDSQRRTIAVEMKQIPKNAGIDGEISYDIIIDLRYVKVNDIQPNSFVWVFNPFDNVVTNELYKKPITSLTEQEKKDAMAKIDRYAYYNFIRLPDWLVGSNEANETDASAYRAYSGISPTQKCLARYWPQEGRMRIEDPCSGDLYRSWDGLAFGGPAGQGFSGGFTPSGGSFQGLASLDLTIDTDGYVIAQRPNISPNSNGIAGEGRVFSVEQLQQSNQELIAVASSHLGYDLPFVTNIYPDYRLADIRESEQFANFYDVNSEGSVFLVLQAVYVDSRSYEGIVITSAPLDGFPSLSFDSVTDNVDGLSVPDLNNTDLRSLLGIYGLADYDDNCYFTSGGSEVKISYSLVFGSEIVGKYAIFHAPDLSMNQQQSLAADENHSCASHAVIWGKSRDGNRDIVVQIQTINYDLEQLQSLVRGLPIK